MGLAGYVGGWRGVGEGALDPGVEAFAAPGDVVDGEGGEKFSCLAESGDGVGILAVEPGRALAFHVCGDAGSKWLVAASGLSKPLGTAGPQ